MQWNERVKTGEKEDNRGIVPCLNCKCDIYMYIYALKLLVVLIWKACKF